MDWGLIVDTDSLYREMEERFFSQERVDYLQLPKILLEMMNLDSFEMQKALVLRRKGTMWKSFSDSLERFGYDIVLTERGVQNMTLALEMSQMSMVAGGLVLVTASKRVGPIVDSLKKLNKPIKIAAFEWVDSSDGVDPKSFLQLDRRCLWTGEQGLNAK